MAHRWQDLLSALVAGQDLTADQTGWAMDEVLSGAASDVHLAAFAVALRAKGETVAELAGMADQMLAKARPISLEADAVDIVGTGGDRANTVNVSTMSAVTAAAAGATVAKHGNRAASSACGTADVLEELGVVLDLPAEKQQQVMDAAGIVFLFASHYHASLRHAAGVRAGLGIATTFNLLGPLSNPARPRAQAIGIADARSAGLIAGVLAARGVRGLVFHGDDGLDELTTTTDSRVWLVNHGRVVETRLDPTELGIARARVQDLVGGDRVLNARIARDTFAGAGGPVRDIVTLNTAAALLAHAGPDLDRPLTEQLNEKVELARQTLDSGAAAAKLEQWVQATRTAAGR
ncbi:anthranilate phosphoribosyltransferase [Enemella dayhoffiae]|uniref:Anthranilate phosphoribosyltransferase n=1 Tax=Enemella dayhoffiae TaxID=2016507 RepID=A0A255H9X2_9ACTN|nr:anthranilate phosphoribosyltransferase [Enemella dayhoffiae]OYO24608.1 anthranilate phosphoribosyltransferase [Enemella dayhoffiae]